MIVDSGATRHFSPNLDNFTNCSEIPPAPICMADGRSFSAISKGDYNTHFPMGANKKLTRTTLLNTYYSPHMVFTLISVSTLNHAGYSVHVENANCMIITPKPTCKTIAIFLMVRGLYHTSQSAKITSLAESAYLASSKITVYQLHKLMGHADQNILKRAVKELVATGNVTGF
ncbi:hypothetical protein B0H10DRAFT_1788138 [Mycena sp. CBHHK59/15]|nr:hypothetical protein B0H10DRAFT_1788138 [Mycena sp. CBHHK59/15]